MRKANGIKMKKIMCLTLVIACALLLFACANPANALVEVVNNSSPTKIVTNTYYTAGKDKLVGTFTSYIAEDSVTLDYEYQYYAPVAPGNERIDTKDGTVTYKDGKYSTDGDSWFAESPTGSLTDVGLNLDLKKLGSYELLDNGRTLEAVLTVEEAKEVLGLNISATEDGITLTVETNGTKITMLTVSYATENANVVIKTSYEYTPVQAPVQD